MERWRSAWLGRQALARLRQLPFYCYLVARTKYYDAVFTEAVAAGSCPFCRRGCPPAAMSPTISSFAAPTTASGVVAGPS
jgi:hypothetical protein